MDYSTFTTPLTMIFSPCDEVNSQVLGSTRYFLSDLVEKFASKGSMSIMYLYCMYVLVIIVFMPGIVALMLS